MRHIRRLVPVEYRARSVEVVNLQQPVFQIGEDRVGRLPVHGAIAMPLELGGGFLSELDRAGPGLSVASHACRHELPASSYTHPRLKTTASEARSWSLRRFDRLSRKLAFWPR